MQELEKILEENGLTKEKMLDILLDIEFGKNWNGESGKRFRKAVIDLMYAKREEQNE